MTPAWAQRQEALELVASFQECTCYSPWPWWRSSALAECGARRKIRGTPRQRVGRNAHDHRLFCSCTPEMYEPQMHAFSPYISKGEDDQQNSQQVQGKSTPPRASSRFWGPPTIPLLKRPGARVCPTGLVPMSAPLRRLVGCHRSCSRIISRPP
jgi:hypothetical protein